MSFFRKVLFFALACVVVSIGIFVFVRMQQPEPPIEQDTPIEPRIPIPVHHAAPQSETSDTDDLQTGGAANEIVSDGLSHGEPKGASVSEGERPAQRGADDNPVPRAVKEDSRRDLEWIRADREYQAKYRALEAEQDKLWAEREAHRPEPTPENIDRILNMSKEEKEAFAAEVRAWLEKSADLQKRMEALRKEKPIRPVGTYTHD